MYRPVQAIGDTVQVPQMIFTKLTAPGANDNRFRVALYVVSRGAISVQETAEALHLKEREAEKALEFWEGAGLLERLPEQSVVVSPESIPTRKRLNTSEVSQAGADDQMLGMLFGELQRIFGGVIGQKDINIFATLYLQDRVPVDLIMVAASHCAAMNKFSAVYVEKVILSWRREGIHDCDAADRYLKLLETRQQKENELAEMMGMPAVGFTLAEKKRIAEWFEVYKYDLEMIQSARISAGEKENEIRYLHAILKRWYSKGYQNPRDVQQAEDNRNMRVQSNQNIAPEDDLLMQAGYVPMKRRRGEE